MSIKQLLGWERSIKIPLEAQIANTQFRSSFPEDQLDYNTWMTYIYKQLNPRIRLPRKKK